MSPARRENFWLLNMLGDQRDHHIHLTRIKQHFSPMHQMPPRR